MPRDDLLKGRFSHANQLYHVTLCTESRKTWFYDIHCARMVIKQMRKLHEEKIMDSIAWVLMPDHLHWLFQLGEIESLSNAIKTLKGRTSIELNAYLKHKGAIWQRGFYDHALRKAENIEQTARYIIANPLRAGLVEQIGDYPSWDSIYL